MDGRKNGRMEGEVLVVSSDQMASNHCKVKQIIFANHFDFLWRRRRRLRLQPNKGGSSPDPIRPMQRRYINLRRWSVDLQRSVPTILIEPLQKYRSRNRINFVDA